MRFINNWLSQLTADLAATDTALPLTPAALTRLDLGSGGEYLLTITDSADLLQQTRWEVVRVTDAAGEAGAERGPDAQDWPAGAYIYAAVTAEHMSTITAQLADLTARITALEQGGVLPDGALVDENGNVLVDDQGNILTMGA